MGINQPCGIYTMRCFRGFQRWYFMWIVGMPTCFTHKHIQNMKAGRFKMFHDSLSGIALAGSILARGLLQHLPGGVSRTPMKIHQWSSMGRLRLLLQASLDCSLELGGSRDIVPHGFIVLHLGGCHGDSPRKKTMDLAWWNGWKWWSKTSNIHETCGFTKLIELVRKIPFRAHCYKIFPFLIF